MFSRESIPNFVNFCERHFKKFGFALLAIVGGTYYMSGLAGLYMLGYCTGVPVATYIGVSLLMRLPYMINIGAYNSIGLSLVLQTLAYFFNPVRSLIAGLVSTVALNTWLPLSALPAANFTVPFLILSTSIYTLGYLGVKLVAEDDIRHERISFVDDILNSSKSFAKRIDAFIKKKATKKIAINLGIGAVIAFLAISTLYVYYPASVSAMVRTLLTAAYSAVIGFGLYTALSVVTWGLRFNSMRPNDQNKMRAVALTTYLALVAGTHYMVPTAFTAIKAFIPTFYYLGSLAVLAGALLSMVCTMIVVQLMLDKSSHDLNYSFKNSTFLATVIQALAYFANPVRSMVTALIGTVVSLPVVSQVVATILSFLPTAVLPLASLVGTFAVLTASIYAVGQLGRWAFEDNLEPFQLFTHSDGDDGGRLSQAESDKQRSNMWSRPDSSNAPGTGSSSDDQKTSYLSARAYAGAGASSRGRYSMA